MDTWVLKNTNRVDVQVSSTSNNWNDAAHEMFVAGQKNVLWEDRELLDLDFSGTGITLHFFEKCTFIKMNFSGNVWEDSEFEDSKFSKCNFTNNTFKTCRAYNSTFENCNFFN